MKAVAGGLWGTSHWILDSIGRGAAGWLHSSGRLTDDTAYSMTGGAIVGALLGAGLGFALADRSYDLGPAAGAAVGGLLGVCTGIGCGAIVQSFDDCIRGVIDSLKPK